MPTSNSFDPNGLGILGNLFGLPYTYQESDIVIVPVPWEVTVSYGSGAAGGPSGILQASSQIDLNHRFVKDPWLLKTTMLEESVEVQERARVLRPLAAKHIEDLESGGSGDATLVIKVNEGSAWLHTEIEECCDRIFDQGKIPVLVGGDHSTSLGCVKSHCKQNPGIGLLQIDAHADLRPSYERFKYSHASIMYNVLEETDLEKLVQVGIRDYCIQEENLIIESSRIETFFDSDFKHRQLESKYTWKEQVDHILKCLPDFIYISFDIDGLDPSLCPQTGTPVPGGLSFEEVRFLLGSIVRAGKKIVGFDLVEVAGTAEWDANVGARVLFELLVHTGATNSLLKCK